MAVLTFAQPFQIWVPPTPSPGWVGDTRIGCFNAVLQGTYKKLYTNTNPPTKFVFCKLFKLCKNSVKNNLLGLLGGFLHA